MRLSRSHLQTSCPSSTNQYAAYNEIQLFQDFRLNFLKSQWLTWTNELEMNLKKPKIWFYNVEKLGSKLLKINHFKWKRKEFQQFRFKEKVDMYIFHCIIQHKSLWLEYCKLEKMFFMFMIMLITLTHCYGRRWSKLTLMW